MNRNVNAISGRLSLRLPQRCSLEILHRITEIAPPGKPVDLAAALAAIRGEFPTVTDFEREFASLCFALATGVGKTRLMGAFIVIKEPAVVTRKDFDPKGMSPEAIERLKLEDGVRMHEQTKVLLETYAREAEVNIVKPFMLIIARDTTHAKQLLDLIQSEEFFEGRYKEKVIQVDSSKTGAEEDEMVERLLKVEHNDEPTEIVIHVNMLKEGWDVTNLYTIVPLRAANARILIEQSIGRGLRLPYGKRTGVAAVDRLSIIAHDKFQEIIDEANKPGSVIQMQQIILGPEEVGQKTETVVSQSTLATKLGVQPEQPTGSTKVAGAETPAVFTNPEDQRVATLAYDVMKRLESKPHLVPTVSYLDIPEIQSLILQEVTSQYRPTQPELEGIVKKPDMAAIVSKTAQLFQQGTIPIPRIQVVPCGAVKTWFEPFALELATVNYPPVKDEMWVQYLRTGLSVVIGLGEGGIEEKLLEDYVVSGLVDFDDVAYDSHSDLREVVRAGDGICRRA